MKERFDGTLQIDVTKPIDPKCFDNLHIDLPKEPGVYRVEMSANDYPNCTARVYKLTSGDVLFIPDTNPVKLGDKYKNYPATISQIVFEPKKWWQFWKHKRQIGYQVRWL